MAVVSMRQLLESGVHFGHQTRRWNPKMKRFIMTERNGIYIIDLQQSLAYIDRSYAFIKGAVASGGNVLFVGTKKQAQEAIEEQAKRVGMPFVSQRWLGGMLTNFQTVHQRIQRLKELEEVDFDDVGGSGRTKKELLHMRREKEKLSRTLGGIRDMPRVPAAVWIVDTNKEHLAVDEARKLGIPVVAILDSNCDPDMVDFPIPGNDDAIRSVNLLTRVVADAVADGLMARAGVKSGDEAPGEELGAEEPLAEWERELLVGDATAAAPVSPAAETPEPDTGDTEGSDTATSVAQTIAGLATRTIGAVASRVLPTGADTDSAETESAETESANSTHTDAADSADTTDSADSADSANTADTADTADTGTAESAESADTGTADGADSTDAADTDTADSTDVEAGAEPADADATEPGRDEPANETPAS